MRAGRILTILLLVTMLTSCLPEEAERTPFLGLTQESALATDDVAFSAVRRYTDYIGTRPAEHTDRRIIRRIDWHRAGFVLLTLFAALTLLSPILLVGRSLGDSGMGRPIGPARGRRRSGMARA